MTFTLNPQSAGNHVTIQEWIDALATTTEEQTTGNLSCIVEISADGRVEKQAFCCLGFGANLIGLPKSWDWDTVGQPVYYAGVENLAPSEFISHLGLFENDEGYDPSTRGTGEFDLYIDHDETLTAQDVDGNPFAQSLTAAGLNDAGFTFAQIAQTIAYFGLKEVS